MLKDLRKGNGRSNRSIRVAVACFGTSITIINQGRASHSMLKISTDITPN